MAEQPIIGLEHWQAALRRFPDIAPRMALWLHSFHETQIMTQAKRYAPVRHGILRGSGRVAKPDFSVAGGLITNIISRGGFGGPAKRYAFVQHEDLWWSRKLKKLVPKKLRHTSGRSKFYATAVAEAAPKFTAGVIGEWNRLMRDLLTRG